MPVAVQMTANDRMTKGLSGPSLARIDFQVSKEETPT